MYRGVVVRRVSLCMRVGVCVGVLQFLYIQMSSNAKVLPFPPHTLSPPTHPPSHTQAVVLVTHQTDFLPHCDKVAIVRDGTLVYFGPYNAQAQAQLAQDLPPAHLLAVAGAVEQRRGEDEGVGGRGDGADQAHSNSSSKSSKDDDKDTNSNNHNNNKDSNNNNNNNKDSNNNNNNSNTNGTSSSSSSQKRQGISSGNSTALAATNTNSPTTKTTTPQVKELHSATVPITRAAYEYIMQGGWWMVPLCLLVFCCAQATRQVSDYWVRWWTANKYNACTGYVG